MKELDHNSLFHRDSCGVAQKRLSTPSEPQYADQAIHPAPHWRSERTHGTRCRESRPVLSCPWHPGKGASEETRLQSVVTVIGRPAPSAANGSRSRTTACPPVSLRICEVFELPMSKLRSGLAVINLAPMSALATTRSSRFVRPRERSLHPFPVPTYSSLIFDTLLTTFPKPRSHQSSIAESTTVALI